MEWTLANVIRWVFLVGGVAIFVFVARRLWWAVQVRNNATVGILHSRGRTVNSPLTGESVLFCRWTVTRRLLSQGRNDVVTDEVIADFEVDLGESRESTDVNELSLHLSPECESAWTTRWEGLRDEAKVRLQEDWPEAVSRALYHCHQVLLVPEMTVTYCANPPILSDRSPSDLVQAAWSQSIRRIVLACIFIGLAVGF
jgi:hypothetical protein